MGARASTLRVVPGSIFEVMFVCTGNRFRSPLAEAVFRRATAGLPVAVGSRGTLELGSIPPLPEATREGARLDLDLSAHRTHPLLGCELGGADLVVGFERMHVVTAVVEAHARRERTFTLPEIVGLLDRIGSAAARDGVERARRTVAAAGAARRDDPLRLNVPELADPLGGTPETFRRTADQVDELTRRLAVQLFY